MTLTTILLQVAGTVASGAIGWLWRHFFPPASVAPVASVAGAEIELAQVPVAKMADAIAKDGV